MANHTLEQLINNNQHSHIVYYQINIFIIQISLLVYNILMGSGIVISNK